jgi:ornithine decarboxylase
MEKGHHVLPQDFEVGVGKLHCGVPTLDQTVFFPQDDNYSSDGESGHTSGNSSDGESLPSSTPEPDSRSEEDSRHTRFALNDDLSRAVGKPVISSTEFSSVPQLIHTLIEEGLESGSFLVTNLKSVVDQFKQWKAELPMVEPFYAVKCNPDVAVVRLLASLGCSFDCATMGEIDLVVNGLGDDYSFGPRDLAGKSIVYANPAKMDGMLKFAMSNGVRMTVFDGEDELYKIAKLGGHNMDLLLRLTTDDRASVCRFSKKFGCPVDEAPKLLEVAKSLGLHVAGVSFHVGSGCGDSAAYTTALEHSLRVFKAAEDIGMAPMTIVDLGGGFPGDTGGYGGEGMPTFQDLARAIRVGISHFAAKFKRPISDVRFIAEPGRYFVSASTMIATKVYARKGGKNDYQALYVDDGVYGSFNNVVYDHANPVPQKLESLLKADDLGKSEVRIPSAVFGPTCDGLDQMCSLETTMLPRCFVDDWIVWDNMGAYTHTASFVFNGYTHFPKKYHCE